MFENSKNFFFNFSPNSMVNAISIAKKEFGDLLNSKLVFFILVVYGILILKTVYDLYDSVLSVRIVGGEELVNLLLIGLNYILSNYGSFIGVVIGFTSMTSEKNTNALSILLVKPVFRDTIISGKLIGAIGFIACIFGLTAALYTSALLMVAGSSLIPVIFIYLSKLPMQFILSLSYVLIFFILSMMLSSLIEEPAFALAAGILVVFISDVITLISVAGFLSNIISPSNPGMFMDFIVGLSPSGMMSYITHFLYPLDVGLSAPIGFEVVKLMLYLFVVIVLNYIVFLRRDVA